VFYLDNKIGQFLVADKFGRFLHDRRQILVGRFYWQTKLANFIDRLTSALQFQSHLSEAKPKWYILVLEAVVDGIDWYAAGKGTEAVERHRTKSWLLAAAAAESLHWSINDRLKLLRQLNVIPHLQCTATLRKLRLNNTEQCPGNLCRFPQQDFLRGRMLFLSFNQQH